MFYKIVRADGTYMWLLDYHYVGLKRYATKSFVPIRVKTLFYKIVRANGTSALTSADLISIYVHPLTQCHRHVRSCSRDLSR